MLEFDLRTHLASFEALTSLIGADSTSAKTRMRLFPVKIPQDPVFPCVVYRRLSTARDLAMDGPTGLAVTRLGFQVCGADANNVDGYAQAKAVVEVMRKILDGMRGSLGGPSGTRVQVAQVANERDDYVDDVKAYVVSFEVTFSYDEMPGL